jgi:hypothetical protein
MIIWETIGESRETFLLVVFHWLLSTHTPRAQISSCYHPHVTFLRNFTKQIQRNRNVKERNHMQIKFSSAMARVGNRAFHGDHTSRSVEVSDNTFNVFNYALSAS